VSSGPAATPRVGVLGAGSFGTALAVHVAARGLPIRLWARDAETAAAVERTRFNEEYLPGVELPPHIEVSSELSLLADCDPILVAVPSHGLREIVRGFFESTAADVRPVMVSASKGVELDGHARMSEVLTQEASRAGRSVPVAALSGPTFAGELARGVPSAAVIASDSEEVAGALCELLASRTLRLYSSTDRIGVELGGATKNVIAIGAGMVHGLSLGQNTQAALITRGLHELTRLGVACGGRQATFSGLAGLGDLVLTCTGGASRNRAAGIALAEGRTLEEIRRATHSVAEGLINTRSVASLAAHLGVEMPITEQMEAVIYGGKKPARALAELMTRDLKAESE
jgi:glycerol-3-phosphate dehydrogenase (NAD(P)+)